MCGNLFADVPDKMDALRLAAQSDGARRHEAVCLRALKSSAGHLAYQQWQKLFQTGHEIYCITLKTV